MGAESPGAYIIWLLGDSFGLLLPEDLLDLALGKEKLLTQYLHHIVMPHPLHLVQLSEALCNAGIPQLGVCFPEFCASEFDHT
jgi:hypothetical protein